MEIYTIGFTKTSAEDFFGRLADARIQRLLDIRLNNTSQLAGFAKARDLEYFLDSLLGAKYEHADELAPTKEILERFKKHRGDWGEYEWTFTRLMRKREIFDRFPPNYFMTRTALLCSEATAEHCHRRLVAEMFAAEWPGVRIVHL